MCSAEQDLLGKHQHGRKLSQSSECSFVELNFRLKLDLQKLLETLEDTELKEHVELFRDLQQMIAQLLVRRLL